MSNLDKLYPLPKKVKALPKECQHCQFYERGFCHRYPPTGPQTSGYTTFAEVRSWDWCGEWKNEEHEKKLAAYNNAYLSCVSARTAYEQREYMRQRGLY